MRMNSPEVKTIFNGIESFWAFIKRRMRKFNGLKNLKFPVHLKEPEFRWNLRHDNIYNKLLVELQESPL